MRISDWSSDVCSSDLSTLARSFSETPLGVGESCPVNMAAPAMPATPAMPAAPAAAPVKQEVAAAPTPQSAADALAAAAVAMQAAASALKAEQAARPSSPVVAAGAEVGYGRAAVWEGCVR